MIVVFHFDTVCEFDTFDDLRQLVLAIQFSPRALGHLDQLEDHELGSGSRQATLGSLGAMTHGGKRAFDRVRGSHMLPMLGREVIEGQQDLAVFGQALGVVTLSNCSHVNFAKKFCSSGSSSSLPYAHRLIAKLAQRLTGNQMALDVEGVVDGGVSGEKSLG